MPTETRPRAGWPLFSPGLLVVLVLFCVSALSLGLLIPVLPLFFSDRGASAGQVGLLVAIGSGVEGVFEGVWGWVSDLVGVVPIIGSRMFVLPLLLFLFTRAQDVGLLYILQLLRGIADAAVWPLGRAYIGQSMPAHYRGRGMAVVQSVIVISMSLGSLAGGLVRDRLGYDAVFYCALSLLLVGGVMVVARREALAVSRLRQAPSQEQTLAPASPADRGWRGRLARIAFVVSFANVGFGTVSAFVPLYGAKVIGLSGGQIGAVLMISGLASVPVLLMAGRLCDHLGRKLFILGGLTAYGIAIAAISITGSFWALLICVGAAALGRATMLPAMLALASEVMPARMQGRAMGLLGVGEAVGISLGPALGGWAWELYGPPAAFLVTGGIMAVGAGLGLGLIREKQWAGICLPAS